MVTRAELKGKWNQIKGQVRERWGQITDSDFSKVEGNVEQLVGMIQEKTGIARQEIEKFLDQALESGETMIQNVTETARKYASQAGEVVYDQYEQAGKNLEAGYEEAERMVRSRPAESVGMAFVAGIFAGALATLLLRSNRA